jgi:Tim44-like domain
MSDGGVGFGRETLQFTLAGSHAGTGAIRAHDPGFDQTSFLAWTQEVHFAVVTALNNLDSDSLRQYLAESLYLRLSAQIAQAKTQGKPLSREEPNSERPTIVRAESNPTYDTVVVRLHPTAGSSDQAATHHQPGAVDWTFQRSSKLITSAGPPQATTAETCSSCGAPLKLDDHGDCVYCHTPAPTAKFDWVLVEMEAAAPDPSPLALAGALAGAATGRKSHWGLFVVLILIVTIGVPVTLAIVNAAHHSTPTSVGSNTGGSGAPTKTLTVQLTLTGAIGLSPSTIDMNDFSLNGGSFGNCPTTPLKSIGLNLTFDSGDQLTGTFMLPAAAKPGVLLDFSPGGTAMLHQIGATGAAVDDQTWSLPAGKKGAVTVMVDASGGGTLTWQNLPSGEPSNNSFEPLSGVATWTCS